MKKNWLVVLVMLTGINTPSLLDAYNFLYIHPTTGQPVRWDDTQIIKYWLDPGSLGQLTNDQAHTLLKEAMKLWENASPEANLPKFEFAGYLPQDINGTNYQQYVSQFPCYTDNLSSCSTDSQKNLQTVIIFDEDDSILNNEFCKIGGCSAFGTASVFSGNSSNPSNIAASTLILGTSVGSSDEKIAAAVGVMTHELGHLLGLAHPSLNQQLYFDQPNGWEALMPTMFFHLVSPQDIVSATLNPDDIAGISTLYPASSFAADTGTINGQISKSDGSPMEHADLIVRNVADPLCEAYSMLSDRFCAGNPGVNNSVCFSPSGDYTISGLPPGSYTLEVEEVVDDPLNAALAVAPGVIEQLAGDAEFWNEGDQASEDHLTSSVITLAAGETKDNVNIILDNNAVTPDRIQYIPLSTFTPGPGTRCPTQPPIDYAALIGIDESSGSTTTPPTSPTRSSGGCSLIP